MNNRMDKLSCKKLTPLESVTFEYAAKCGGYDLKQREVPSGTGDTMIYEYADTYTYHFWRGFQAAYNLHPILSVEEIEIEVKKQTQALCEVNSHYLPVVDSKKLAQSIHNAMMEKQK